MSYFPRRAGSRGFLSHEYGAEFRALTTDEQNTAPFETRCRSVWRYVVSLATRWHNRLSATERQSCDLDDALGWVYIELIEKDDGWTPERGKYITYVSSVVNRYLSDLKDRTHTVHSVANTTSRMRKYKEAIERGTISDASREVMRRLERTRAPFWSLNRTFTDSNTSIGDSIEGGRTAEEEAAERESAAISAEAATKHLIEAFAVLGPYEALVLGQVYGLWGQESKTHETVADKFGMSVVACRRIERKALCKLRGVPFEEEDGAGEEASGEPQEGS